MFLLLLLPSLSYAAQYYAVASGGNSNSGSACSDAAPCTLDAAKEKAVGGDTVWLKNGTYNQSFKTVRAGSSNTNRITFKAVNRHGAIIRVSSTSGRTHFHVDHSWITVSGLNIWATNSSGGSKSDAAKISDTHEQHGPIQGVIFEDNYVHHAGHAIMWAGNINGAGAEIRNNTFDIGGLIPKDGWEGEGHYWGSFSTQNPGVINFHHNITSKYKANAIDYKGEYRDGYAHDNFFIDHAQHSCSSCNADCTHDKTGECQNNHTGDGTFVVGCGTGDPCNDNSTNNRIENNVIFRPRSAEIFSFKDAVQIRAFGNVIVDWTPTPNTSNPRMNRNDQYSASATYSNIHCPSEGMSHGNQTNGSNPANQINRPIGECNTRIDQIVGIPEIASCNIGNLNDNTVTVEFSTARNGPVSWVEIPLEVTYNNVNQEGEVTTHVSPPSNNARIAMATAPSSTAVAVRVVAPAGSLHNSAFIGAKDCDNGNDFDNTNYTRTGGFCGENRVALTELCTNTITGGGPPPLTEELDQAVWRFYAINNAEGVDPIAPENTSITSRLGGEFRWRVGVRGGGNNSPSRSYALAARICKPACGPWLAVSDDPNVGVIFLDDLVQDDGTPTTNQLSLGGKTFLAGVFMDQPAPTPAKAITTTQQIEWEFGLQIPATTTAVEVGDTVELRMQHGTGTALSAYTLPSITILGAGPASYGGSITGSIK